MTEPKLHHEWTVLPHGPLTQLSGNLWRVEGSLPGMTLKRTMTVVRLSTGELLLHSVIALSEPTMRELLALGDVAYAVMPNAGHRLDAPAYRARFPRLRFFTPAGGIDDARVAVPDVEPIGAMPPDPAARFETLDGIKNAAEAAMIVRSSDGTTVVLCDTVHHMDPKRDLVGWVMTTMMGSVGPAHVSRAVKHWYVTDAAAFRAHLERLARTPDLVRFIVNHEKVSVGPAARADLERAAATLAA